MLISLSLLSPTKSELNFALLAVWFHEQNVVRLAQHFDQFALTLGLIPSCLMKGSKELKGIPCLQHFNDPIKSTV